MVEGTVDRTHLDWSASISQAEKAYETVQIFKKLWHEQKLNTKKWLNTLIQWLNSYCKLIFGSWFLAKSTPPITFFFNQSSNTFIHLYYADPSFMSQKNRLVMLNPKTQKSLMKRVLKIIRSRGNKYQQQSSIDYAWQGLWACHIMRS